MGAHDSHFEFAAAHLHSFMGDKIKVETRNKRETRDATVMPEITERRKNKQGGYDYVTVRTIFVRGEPIPSNAKVDIDGVNYIAETSEQVPGDQYAIKLKRVAAAEVARPGYRGR